MTDSTARTALVWGADGGIGGALVEALADRGWRVIGVSRRDSSGANGMVRVTADVANSFSVQYAVHAAAFEADAINLWIYAAGDITAARADEMTPDDWRRIMDANLTGAYLTAHHSMPLLAPDAHLVFIGAISERLRLPGLSAYAAAKAGLEAFCDALRKEQRGRRVTLVRPSAVATPLWAKVPLRQPKDAPPPSYVADRILAAHDDGHTGTLDLA